MMKVHPLPVNLRLKWFTMDLYPEFLRKKITHPEVVIPGEIMDRNVSIGKLLQCGESSVKSLGNDGSVFEPEIKEVTKDKQFSCGWKYGCEERQKLILLFLLFQLACQTQMYVRDEECAHQ